LGLPALFMRRAWFNAHQGGVEKGYLPAHTTSAEVIAGKFGQPSRNSVGCAAVLLCMVEMHNLVHNKQCIEDYTS